MFKLAVFYQIGSFIGRAVVNYQNVKVIVLRKDYINQMTDIFPFIVSWYNYDFFHPVQLILEYENTIIQIVQLYKLHICK